MHLPVRMTRKCLLCNAPVNPCSQPKGLPARRWVKSPGRPPDMPHASGIPQRDDAGRSRLLWARN